MYSSPPHRVSDLRILLSEDPAPRHYGELASYVISVLYNVRTSNIESFV